MTAQTDQYPEVETIPELLPEQASTNFYWLFGKYQVFNLQTTVRGIVDPLQMEAHFESVKYALKQVVEMGGQAKQIGKDQPAARAEPQNGSVETHPISPAPQPATQGTNGNGTHEAHCVLIEVGTSYSGGKTQLKFTCDGIERPLAFTKSVGEMVALLAPLGYTAEHIVIGKRYGANATVRYTENTNAEGKTYKNVQSVAPR